MADDMPEASPHLIPQQTGLDQRVSRPTDVLKTMFS